jgi:hypothetical protein
MSAIQQVLATFKDVVAAPAYYYSTPGSGSYDGSGNYGPGSNACGAYITAGQTGTITKIGFRIVTTNAKTTKVALYTNVANPVLLASGSVAHSAAGWHDYTVSVPVTIGEIVQVWVVASDTVTSFYRQSASNYVDSNNTLTYAAFPTNPIATVRTVMGGNSPAVRIEVTP